MNSQLLRTVILIGSVSVKFLRSLKNGPPIGLPKAGFPLGEFVRANKQKANVIGWG